MRCSDYIILLLLGLFLIGCTQDPIIVKNAPEAPQIKIDITSRVSAELTIVASYQSSDITYGSEIVKIVNGDESDERLAFQTDYLGADKSYTWMTSDLQPGNTYIARTFISNGRNRKYSSSKTFTTPSTSKATLSSVSLEGDILTAHIVDNGGRKIEDVGFIAGDTPDRKALMRAEKTPASNINGNTFSLPLSNFRGGKTYYFIAYAIDDKEDIGYGTTPFEQFLSLPVESITLDKDYLTLEEEETVTLRADIYPEDATDKTITWGSSNIEVARVVDGTVTAIKEGTAVITATSGGISASCIITVTKKFIPVTSVTLIQSLISIEKGKTIQLEVTVQPDDATDKTITWSSSDQSVANVDKTGLVSAQAGGSAIITATAGEMSATCEIIVYVPVSGISLDHTSLTLEIGQTATLKETISPEDATDKTLTWSSSNTSIATISNGTITAITEGTAVITVTAGERSASCNITVKKAVVAVTSITLNKTNLSLNKGASEILTATVKPDDATDKTVFWSSSNASVVNVDQTGKVSALSGGSATITATAGEKSTTSAVSVIVPVTSITLDQTSLSLEIGQTATLKAIISPEDATDKSIVWSSSNSSVATVSDGIVKALAEGAATIYASVGGKSASCIISVSKGYVAVISVSLNKSSLTLTQGSSETLIATVKPDDATDKTVSWSSSNTAIATVFNGTVTAISEGTATIYASAGDKYASCSITVSKGVIAVTSITLNKTSLTLVKGTSETLVATVKPDDATDKTVTWSSSNTAIAIVSNGTVSAIEEGTAIIYASAGDKTAPCSVTVSKEDVVVTSVTLNKTSLTLVKGTSETLVATVKEDDADDKTLTWTSSDEAVAMVSQSGYVLAVSTGTCDISATAGGKSAVCNVNVIIPVTSISLDQTEMSLYPGEAKQLTATVLPSDATDKTVTWTSSDESVATVSNSGIVTGIANGSCTITAKAGDYSDYCSVGIGGIPLNSDYFPDLNFRKIIKDNYDNDKDGILSDDEISKIVSISNSNKTGGEISISSLKGIEYFTSLSYLYCVNCQNLSFLDISNNLALRTLTCSGCNLTDLNIINNTELVDLDCRGNQISSLDLSNKASLRYLHCENNLLSTLDVSNCTVLELLYCYDNQITGIDVRKNDNLKYFNCLSNPITDIWLKYSQKFEQFMYPESATLHYE